MLNRYSNILFITILSFLAMSCSKEEREIVPRYKTSAVNFNLDITNIKLKEDTPQKVSKIDIQNADFNVIRGDAPIEIKGVDITSTHYEQKDEYGYPLTAYKSIYFSDKDSDSSLSIPASMNVVLGRNRFTAYSILEDDIEAKNEKYKNIEKCSEAASDSERLQFYNKELKKLQPVYAQYSGETTVDIQGNNPSVNIKMKTQQARLNIVLENNTRFRATFFVFYALDYANTNMIISKANSNTSSAFVLNAPNISSYAVNIYVRYYRNSGWTRNEGYLKYNGSYDIRVNAGVNKTIIYNLKRPRTN